MLSEELLQQISELSLGPNDLDFCKHFQYLSREYEKFADAVTRELHVYHNWQLRARMSVAKDSGVNFHQLLNIQIADAIEIFHYDNADN